MYNEGKTTSVYYKDLTQEEKDYVDNLERNHMRKVKADFLKDERYKGYDPEKIWYLKEDYINNFKHSAIYLFTRCECGSLEFNTISDTPGSHQQRICVMVCDKCGKMHTEYN